ncbi:uncharacterized protein [Apostichopus japonicus]|uniref:uncharacterized protein isoform X2 n=1 Tax=Stichopus japonicus TaxID=307972 RepID=UPI003AB40CD8
MIWGFTLQSGVPYTKTVESEVHLTMAALDENCNNDIAGKTRCQVLVRVHSTDDLLLCTLVDGLIFQQNLNLTLMPGEKATFHAKGGKVHLTGYSKSHSEDNSQLFRDEEREDNISQRDNENQNRICVPKEDCIDEILEEVQTVTSGELESSAVQVKQEIFDNHSLDSPDVCAPKDKKTSLVSVKTEEPDEEGRDISQQEQPESSSSDAHDESVPFTCGIQTTTDTSTQHPDVECIQEAIALSRSPSPVPEHHNIPATEQNEAFDYIHADKQSRLQSPTAGCSSYPSPPPVRFMPAVQGSHVEQCRTPFDEPNYSNYLRAMLAEAERLANQSWPITSYSSIDSVQTDTLPLQEDIVRDDKLRQQRKRLYPSRGAEPSDVAPASISEAVSLQPAAGTRSSSKRKCLPTKRDVTEAKSTSLTSEVNNPVVSVSQRPRSSQHQSLPLTLIPRVVLHAKEVIRNFVQDEQTQVEALNLSKKQSAIRKKSAQSPTLVKSCACCKSKMSKHYKIKLGDREHYFCFMCHKMFTQDKQLQKYVRIIPHPKNKPSK